MNENKSYDEQKAEQIAQLQKIVDDYRTELHTAHEELSKREAPPLAQDGIRPEVPSDPCLQQTAMPKANVSQ